MKETLDFRGSTISNALPPRSLTVCGASFKKVLLPERGKALVYVDCRERGTNVTFYRPYFEDFNSQAFYIDFPSLKSDDLPDVVVKPKEVATSEGECLADCLVAQRGKITVNRKGQKIEFILEFNGQTHRVIKPLSALVNATHRLRDFIEIR